MAFKIVSSAFGPKGRLPALYTCDGADTPPPLRWSGAPAATQSFALVCSDPDAPAGTWYHWALCDIPADTTELAGDAHEQYRQSINDFGNSGYGGPCPPPGHGIHHYRFALYALKVAKLPLKASSRCRDVERAAKANALGMAEVIGLYSR